MSDLPPLKVMIAAGEVSGDMYGGALIAALRARFPGRRLEVRGMGGDALRAAGADLLYHTDALGAMGIVEVLAKLRFFRRVLRDMVGLARDWRPDLLITLDYYSFNIALAERVHALGIRTAHYISPKVWVWRKGRIKRMARAFDLLLCIFPFEPALYGIQVFPVRVLLIVYDRFLESLRQIHAMHGTYVPQSLSVCEVCREIESLFVQEIRQIEKEAVPRDVVEPVDRLQIVGYAVPGPESPVPERFLWQRFQLVPEISGHEVYDTRVSCRGVVLLEYFQHHHPRPPVSRVVPLQSVFVRVVFCRAEISVFLLAFERPFYPRLDLFLEIPVIEDIGQRQEPVYPVRASFPLVSVASEPSVAFSHDLRVECIHVPCRPFSLADEHFLEPSFGLYCPDRKFDVRGRSQRSAVAGIKSGIPGICRCTQHDAGEYAQKVNKVEEITCFHID